MQRRKVRCMCDHILEFFLTFQFSHKFLFVRTMFFNNLDYNIKKSCLLVVLETKRLLPTRVMAVYQQARP